MRPVWLAAILVGCGQPPVPVVSNVAPVVATPSGRPSLAGIVTDAETQEVLAGVTVVVNDQKDAVAITDEQGAYKIDLPRAGRYIVTYYYLELTVERVADVGAAAKIDQEIDQRWIHGSSTMRCLGPRATDCRRKR